MTAIQTEISRPLPVTTVEHVLTLDCPETPGIVHAVSGFLLEQGADIIDNKQFGERSEGHFFMRVHFASDGDASTADTLRTAFAPVAERFGMSWRLEPHGSKRRVLIMVSKFGHCLNDLLFRARIGELPVDVVAVVSNHTDHQTLVEWHGIPFFHVPVTAATKPASLRPEDSSPGRPCDADRATRIASRSQPRPCAPSPRGRAPPGSQPSRATSPIAQSWHWPNNQDDSPISLAAAAYTLVQSGHECQTLLKCEKLLRPPRQTGRS